MAIGSESKKEYWFSASLSEDEKKDFLVWAEKVRYIFTNNIHTL